jgi:hypothetical protein
MNHPLPRIAAAAFLWASLTMSLAGCGGGGSSGGSAADTNRTSASVTSTTVTVAEYKALRMESATAGAGEVPDAATLSKLAADNRHLAVMQLSNPAYDANLVAIPPLSYTALRSVAAAASGTSLTEISRRFDISPSPFVAAQQTSRVSSQWWATRGFRFRSEFLAATDSTGPWPRLAAWSVAETGFSDGSAASDATFTQAMSDAKLTSLIPSGSISVRMLAVHSIAVRADWNSAIPFDGVFERSFQQLVRLPMLRLNTGVQRYQGSDFTADVLASADLRIVSLRPSNATLDVFAVGRLEPALTELIAALSSTTALLSNGELVLPRIDLNLSSNPASVLSNVDVKQVFDEVNANLQGLDGVGGTYFSTPSTPVAIHIAEDGLSIRAAQTLDFVFSSRNVNNIDIGTFNGFNNPSSGSTQFTFFTTAICTWPTPDLRPTFLAVVDRQGWIVSIAALRTLPGTAVEPTCH